MVQKYWKFSVGRGRWGNKGAIKNNAIAIFGRGVVDFDMKRFDTNDSRETFKENVKNFLKKSGKKSGGANPAYEALTRFYFIEKRDIIFYMERNPIQ